MPGVRGPQGFHTTRVRTFNPAIHLYDAEKKERALLTTPTGRELSVCSSVDVTVSTVERMERCLSVWKYFLYAAIQSVAMSEYPSVATLLQLWPLLTVSSETIVC